MLKKIWGALCLSVLFCYCSPKQEISPTDHSGVHVSPPAFQADSAYQYILDQVAFGPRVPGTKAHLACENYLVSKFKSFGADVMVQKGELENYKKEKLPIHNIIASFGTEKEDRIMLAAHWDTRPFADMEENAANKTAILGANDGASGVAVLMELARNLQSKSPDIGIDIILFDTEDSGAPFGESSEVAHDWCLGAQYWARNPHKADYKVRHGILLDMVGGKGAIFPQDLNSRNFAQSVFDKLWADAARIGYGKYFSTMHIARVIDDHFYVNNYTRGEIKMINILGYFPDTKTHYHDSWHKLSDTPEQIDPEQLKAVGQTLLEHVFNP